jgi:hypothetical protein
MLQLIRINDVLNPDSMKGDFKGEIRKSEFG